MEQKTIYKVQYERDLLAAQINSLLATFSANNPEIEIRSVLVEITKCRDVNDETLSQCFCTEIKMDI